VKPLDRGLYLLRLHGISVNDDTMESDKNLLMEIMEFNERIDELRSKDDAEKLSEELAGEINGLIRYAIFFEFLLEID
jgi:HSCB C-terminal oligomerisation domain